WYPMLLLGALYAEVGVLNVDLGYQHDLVIQRLELWVFGSQLSYRWIREMPNPLLSWVLHACYLAYYAILYTSPLGLWFSGRRDAARRTIFAVMVTFYLCYVMFLFFPVAGPRYTFDLAHNAASPQRTPLELEAPVDDQQPDHLRRQIHEEDHTEDQRIRQPHPEIECEPLAPGVESRAVGDARHQQDRRQRDQHELP